MNLAICNPIRHPTPVPSALDQIGTVGPTSTTCSMIFPENVAKKALRVLAYILP